MRIHFADDRGTGPDAWRAAFAPVADEFAMRGSSTMAVTPPARSSSPSRARVTA